MAKRMLVMADLHCGHLTGLTPPRWQSEPAKSGSRTKRDKMSVVQREGWAPGCSLSLMQVWCPELTWFLTL